jgi:hypothetical protein
MDLNAYRASRQESEWKCQRALLAKLSWDKSEEISQYTLNIIRNSSLRKPVLNSNNTTPEARDAAQMWVPT